MKQTAEADEQTTQSSLTLPYHRGWSVSVSVKAALENNGVQHRSRDVYALPLDRSEVEVLLEGEPDVRPFLNPRSTEYRDRDMAERTPSAEIAVELISREPDLLQLPILLRGAELKPVQSAKEALDFLGIKPAKKKPARKKPAKKSAVKKPAGAQAKKEPTSAKTPATKKETAKPAASKGAAKGPAPETSKEKAPPPAEKNDAPSRPAPDKKA